MNDFLKELVGVCFREQVSRGDVCFLALWLGAWSCWLGDGIADKNAQLAGFLVLGVMALSLKKSIVQRLQNVGERKRIRGVLAALGNEEKVAIAHVLRYGGTKAPYLLTPAVESLVAKGVLQLCSAVENGSTRFGKVVVELAPVVREVMKLEELSAMCKKALEEARGGSGAGKEAHDDARVRG